MNIQAKVAIDKENKPKQFCPVRRCLWRVVELNHDTQTYSSKADCPGGFCPRHQHMRPAILHTHDGEGRELPYPMTTREASAKGIQLF